MEENVRVERLRTTNEKLPEDTREGCKTWKSNVNEKAQKFPFPTYRSVKAFSGAESYQTFKCSESSKPNFARKNEEKQRYAAPDVEAFWDLSESDGKCSPDWVFEETSNTGDEFKKRNVALDELSSKAVENTTAVLDGHVVDLKALHSMDKTSTEKDSYRGAFGKAMKAEDGAGEPAAKETSKKKQKKKKARSPNFVWKKAPSRTDTMNARPATYSCASYRKPAGENSYPRGIIPVNAQFFTQNVCPANENYNSRGFKPTNEHSLGRGVRSANENHNTRDIRPTNGQSFGRGVRVANQNCNTQDIRPTNGQSFGRGVRVANENCNARDIRPTNGPSFGRGVRVASENYNTQGIRPVNERSFGRGVRPTSGNSCATGVRSSSEHSFANGFRPACESMFVQTCENSFPGSYRPASEHTSAVGICPAGKNSYGQNFRPENELLSAKAICPTSEISYGQSFRPEGDQSYAKGFRPASENSCQRGFRSTSEHSVAKVNCPASQNPYERGLRPTSEHALAKGFYPTSDNSHTRGFKPSNEQSFSKGVPQACETPHTMIFWPTRKNSFAKAFGPPGENKCFATGNSLPKDHQPPSINMSGERKVSFSGVSKAKRDERVLNPIASWGIRKIGMHPSVPGLNVMPRIRRLNTPPTTSHDHFGASGPVSTTYHHPIGARKVAVVKPRPKEIETFSRKVHGPPTECDYIERVLSTDNMFSSRSAGRKTEHDWKKHTNDFRGESGMKFQTGDALRECPRKGSGQFSREGSAGFKAGCQQRTQSTAERHLDNNRGPESDEMEPPLQLKYVNWVRKEDIGHFFVSGLANLDPPGHGESGGHSQPNYLTFDELVLLHGLETAVVSITDSIDADSAKRFVARFPASSSLHLLVNEVDKIYSEYITVCSSCPNLIVDQKVGADNHCPKCRIVRLVTYPDMKIKCQFMLLRSVRMLRFVLLSSSLSICDWENRIQFGWFHDFAAVQEETTSNCLGPSDQKSSSPFSKDLTELLASLQISDLNVLSGIDFSNVSPAVRLIHTKPGVSCTNDPSKYGARQLQQIIRNLSWKSQKKRQSIYKTERLDERGYSILNDVFPNTLSGELQTSAKHVKVVYPSLRWVNECVAYSESPPERLSLLSTVEDISSLEEFPWNFLNDLCENKDFVHNYNVLEQYENWDHAGKTKRYGWFLTGSQALDTDSWGEDYPVYHKVIYKHFQLSVGLFPYLRRNEYSKKVEVCSVDLCDIPLPFDPVDLVPYRRDDMPRLVLDSGQNVFCHCAGVFSRSKRNFGFILQSPLLRGYLDPFPAPGPGQFRHDIFLHLSCLSQPELPPEGSVVEFFFLNQPAIQGRDLVRVCGVFRSIEDAIIHFLAARTPAELEKAHKEMVEAKALSLGLEWIDDVKQMEDAIEDYYNVFFSSQRRGFSYFPTQQQIDAISIEPVKILSDAEWVRNYYKDRRNPGSSPLNIGACRPSELLARFHAMKYRFVKDLREVEERNKQLEAENQGYVVQNWDI